MAGIKDIEGYEDFVINICPDGTEGEIIEIAGLFIQLPEKPEENHILFNELPKEEQYWRRLSIPKELERIRTMDEWSEAPKEFRDRYTPYIEREFVRRRKGLWFYNNGTPTYITGHHYMLLQWSKMDIGYASYLDFQRKLFVHYAACESDPRSVGQVYVKCRRSGYTNVSSSILVDEGTQVAEKLLGIISKTGKDAQENVFMKKVFPMFRSYPFFFKPVQDGTTNPRMELAFREPSKRITKNNKAVMMTQALDTVINWKNTVNNAYDGEKLHTLFLDESGKYESPIDVNELWRIHRTCLLVGKKVVGKALVGSTVNPLDKGGANFRKLYYDSDPKKRNENGRTKSGLYKIFIPAYEALEGFFDQYGLPIVNDPEKAINTMEGDITKIGAKTYLNNERKALMSDPYELNEVIRQFPWTEEEAFRDSTKTSHFNISKIYEQIEHNANLFPNPVIRGNFIWNNGQQDSKVVFAPDPNGKFRVSWLMPFEESNKQAIQNGKRSPGNVHLGVGGVDSYDIDETADGRGSKGAFHFFNKFNMNYPSNRFVLEYAERPELARVFYEDVLMAAVYYGYPLLVENNKYGIVRYFESRGYDNYIMDRPPHLTPPNQRGNVRTKGVPSNSQEFIQAHAQAIEAFIHENLGYRIDTDEYGKMYFDRTLQDWIGYKISDRTKFDLTISSGLALLGAQTIIKENKQSDMTEKVFFRRYKARF
jgi:hypothetical protein